MTVSTHLKVSDEVEKEQAEQKSIIMQYQSLHFGRALFPAKKKTRNWIWKLTATTGTAVIVTVVDVFFTPFFFYAFFKRPHPNFRLRARSMVDGWLTN